MPLAGLPHFPARPPGRQSLDGFTAGWAQRRLMSSTRISRRWEPTGDSELKATWNDLLARFPEPHVLVAVLPDSSEHESIFNAQSAQRLLVRLIKKLPTHGDFAVTISRQSGQREILCAFADSSDAAVVARAASALLSHGPRYSFVLDEAAECNLLRIAGPPEPHRARATASDRWQY